MQLQNTTVFAEYRSYTRRQLWMLIARIAALVVIVLFGLNVMATLRSNVIGENGSTMAIYSLGALFVLVPGIVVFHDLKLPETQALKLAIATVIAVGVWFTIEEKLVLPQHEFACQQVACETLDYMRQPPLVEPVQIEYRARWDNWRVVD